MRLQGSDILAPEGNVIEIRHASRNEFVLLRAKTKREHQDWLDALRAQAAPPQESADAAPEPAVEPAEPAPAVFLTKSGKPPPVIIDIGSCSIRAGLAQDGGCLQRAFRSVHTCAAISHERPLPNGSSLPT